MGPDPPPVLSDGSPSERRPGLPAPATAVLLAVVYFVAGKLGLRLAFFHPSATPVWPPTGITLAAFLLLGYRVWPAILASAFLVNLTTAGTLLTSLGIATGNTLEGLVGAWLVNRFAGGPKAFERPRDVFTFSILAAMVSTSVSATLGVTSLALGGVARWSDYGSIWTTWWLGDGAGDLVVAPVILLWAARPRQHGGEPPSLLEMALLLGSVLLVGLMVFDGLLPFGTTNYPVEFLTLLPLLWAAFRFGQREAATASALLSALAIWGTVRGFGPFGKESPNESLLLLQVFVSVTGVTSLATAAAVSERKRAEHRQAALFAITRILTESATLREAATPLLRTLCQSWGWGEGELWRVDAGATALRCVGRWPSERSELGTRGAGDTAELGLNRYEFGGESGPLAVPWDPAHQDPALSNSATGSLPGLRVWPLRIGAEVAGILTLRGQGEGDRGSADIMEDVASRLAQFIDRERGIEGLRRLEKAVETIEVGITISDTAGRILYTNQAEAVMHGYRTDELIGKPVGIFMPPRWRPASGRPHDVRSWTRDTVNVRRDGTVFPVQLVSHVVTGSEGALIGVVTCCQEITERKRAEEALRSSEERYRLLFERALSGVYRATVGGRLLECNEAFARILGYASREGVLSRTAWDLYFERADREGCLARLREGGRLTNQEVRMRRKDGSSVWVLDSQALVPSQAAQGPSDEDVVEGTLADITERKLAEEQNQYHAFHDPLTGLPNRLFLEDRLQLGIAQARRRGGCLAVIFLDLDHFKEVNDAHGHGVGDHLLQDAAVRLRDCVREEDTLARLGGDEFVLLIHRVRHGDGAARIAEKVLARIGEPFRCDGHELHVTASAGISLFPQDGEDAETLLKTADRAMYGAKELGRDAYRLSSPGTKNPSS